MVCIGIDWWQEEKKARAEAKATDRGEVEKSFFSGTLGFFVLSGWLTVVRNLFAPFSLLAEIIVEWGDKTFSMKAPPVTGDLVAVFLFAPLFILCYVRAESTASAAADAIPLLLMLAFSITNGWITTTVFVRASEDVGDAERGHAAGHIVLFLNTGLAIGAALSFVVHFAACGGCNPFVNPKQQHGLLI